MGFSVQSRTATYVFISPVVQRLAGHIIITAIRMIWIFFVNNVQDFHEQVDKVLTKLKEDGFLWDVSKDFRSRDKFVTLKVYRENPDILLKLDFVNDVAPHFGEFVESEIFIRTDSIRNMLSNKLTALYRFAGKDVADIREIALHEHINWADIINEASQKEAGIDLSIASDIIKGIPRHEFDGVHWINNPGWETFMADIDRIALEMMSVSGGESESLSAHGPPGIYSESD